MKFLLLIVLLTGQFSYAQGPEQGFVEITPEQEKKIIEREQKEKDLIERKQAEEKGRIKEEKRKQEVAKLAAKRKAEEEKKLEAERQKKAEAAAYSKWLISERDRKMKEESLKAITEEEKKETPAVKSNPSVSEPGVRKLYRQRKKFARIKYRKGNLRNVFSDSTDPQLFEYSETTVACKKNKYSRFWEEEYRRIRTSDLTRHDPQRLFSFTTEKKLQEFLCSCRFPEDIVFPDQVKVIGISGYEGKYSGSRTSGMHPETDVTVKVNSREPVILAIDVYEPVRWKIEVAGAPVIGILMIGYYQQKIDIQGNVPTLKSISLADNVARDNRFALGNNLCKASDEALTLEASRRNLDIYREKNNHPEISSKRVLDDRALLLFGRKLSSFTYMYTFPVVIEVGN